MEINRQRQRTRSSEYRRVGGGWIALERAENKRPDRQACRVGFGIASEDANLIVATALTPEAYKLSRLHQERL